MRFSVIIPFYNLETYVHSTLESVLAVIPADAEVICVDDGSTDSTPAVLDAYAARYPFVRVVHQPNGGEGAARNAGVEQATGEWITFLDGDDIWLPNMMTEAEAVLADHSDAEILAFRFLPFDDGAAVPAPVAATSVRVYDTRAFIASDVLMRVGVFPTFFRRALFGDVRFSALPLGADRLYVAACLARANGVVLTDAGVHGYRVREGSMARAAWTARKVTSLVDYGAGSLRYLSSSGKRIGRSGAAYLGDVLLRIAVKYIRRLTEDRDKVIRHWLGALRAVDVRLLTPGQRLRRWWLIWYNSKRV